MTSHDQRAERKSIWHDLLERRINRRSLVATGAAAAAVAALPLDLQTAEAAHYNAPMSAPALAQRQAQGSLPFKPIGTSTADDLILPEGFRYDLLAHRGHDMGNGNQFGENADFLAFFPIDMLEKGLDQNRPQFGFTRSDLSSSDGLLLVNHEYINPMFISGYTGSGAKSSDQINAEKHMVGMSVIRVKRNSDGRWYFDQTDAAHNRRIDATTPITLTGPAANIDGGPIAIGSLGNCSGGVTPWGTALSCEENFQDYPNAAPTGYGWEPEIYAKRHYGWVVEVDPFDKNSTPRKHTALGRFRHENVAVRVGGDGTVVAYMGDDKADSCVYKFVAERKLTNLADRPGNMQILESGQLYAADFANGKWILLDYNSQSALQSAKDSKGNLLFTSQADVLADAQAAAMALKATPVDRPEDIEIHPLDGSVYVALTNNTGHGNFHGQIVRLAETDGNPAAMSFDWSIFAVGGSQSGFSSPDNLVFDGEGNLWMVTDISSSRTNKGIYKFQGNNGLFFFRTSGPDAGIAFQFASGPVECELTGPCWSPDGRTLFLSIQHPGEESKSLTELSSHWPIGGNEVPRSGVVAITGFKR
ncbi:PhoX family protein [Herpetosiphon giganteus]|uniref:PhoX family protein n=1 Tax=Herpetosiphon giganteus TaxID=2029754 RepID=UPI0019596641|nr:alkaline phosphatase PhoX [Herpetosiphon giganteus]MBM7842116.1 secreted PhoX family phosphatase [Herpetosiphon giganteus]